MELTRQAPQGRELIQSYAGGKFRVSDVIYTGCVIVTPKLTLPWAVTALADIALESFAPLLSGEIAVDVCLLGCGAKMQRLAPELRKALKEKGLTVESMDTGAACRTYNMRSQRGGWSRRRLSRCDSWPHRVRIAQTVLSPGSGSWETEYGSGIGEYSP